MHNNTQNTNKSYNQLLVAVQDLLLELRIDSTCLEVMANGYSPDYPGAPDKQELDNWENPHCKVQLSKVVAQKLLDAGVEKLKDRHRTRQLKDRHRTRQLADDPYDASQVRARGGPNNPFAGGSFRDDPYDSDDSYDAYNRRKQIRRSNNPYDAGGR